MDNTIPLFFEKNQGQHDREILYSLSSDTFFTLFNNDEIYVGLPDEIDTKEAPLSLQYFILAMSPSPYLNIIPSNELSGRKHCIINPAIERGFAILPLYQTLTYQDLYSNINLNFHLKDSRLTYEFVVKPGASVNSIQFSVRGQKACLLDQHGNLNLQLASKSPLLPAPKAFQSINKQMVSIDICYLLLDESTISFQTAPYNRNYPLVIKFL